MSGSGTFTGASVVLCAAHRSVAGVLHGHTWEITAWWRFDGTDSLERQRQLQAAMAEFEHDVLPDDIAWAEPLSAFLGERLNCVEVEVGRPLERLFARWVP